MEDHLVFDQKLHLCYRSAPLFYLSRVLCAIHLFGAMNNYLISMATSNRVKSCLNLPITCFNLFIQAFKHDVMAQSACSEAGVALLPREGEM